MDVSNWKCVAVLKVIEKSQLTKNLIGTSWDHWLQPSNKISQQSV
jgi:hypothetical protein